MLCVIMWNARLVFLLCLDRTLGASWCRGSINIIDVLILFTLIQYLLLF